MIDRIRTGLMALYARRISRWEPLENISARDWIRSIAGRRSYEVIWEPLLAGKFGPEAEHVSAVWFWNKLKLRGSSRDESGSEQLLYYQGGFNALASGIVDALSREGVRIHTACEVTRIHSDGKALSDISLGQQRVKADAVLVTTPLPHYLSLVEGLPQDYLQRCSQIRFLGNVCLILRLSRSLSDTYWLNVADPEFPFVGVIEHTNLDSPDQYNGEHIAYISKYLPTSDPLYAMTDEELFEYCLPYIKRIFPDFAQSWCLGYAVWRAEYSQPVITKSYSQLIPREKSPVENIWLSTMAQIYPEDRGTNYAVRHGRAVARRMVENLSREDSVGW